MSDKNNDEEELTRMRVLFLSLSSVFILAFILLGCAKEPAIVPVSQPERDVLCDEFDFLLPHRNDTKLSYEAMDKNRKLLQIFCNTNNTRRTQNGSTIEN